MSQALYRKYRSMSLADIVGQDHVTAILSRALAQGKVSHAYLLTGPRGVGKTSIARILAHEINQLPYSHESHHLDIIEIDAASNNGVDDVRELREKAQVAPTSAKKKVYIIDEVHMLSKPAFNALLKTLEEPPEHVVFILATTDVEKLPPTIVSRTQRFAFRAIDPSEAVSHLAHIAKSEKLKVSKDALQLIAERGDGSFRDSISLLDQLASLADDKEGVTAELVQTSLGLAPATLIDQLLAAHAEHDVSKLSRLLRQSESDGISPTVLCSQLLQVIRLKAVDQPELLGLLDKLLDVPRSAHPSIKLLSVLGNSALTTAPPTPEKKPAETKPKSAALNAPVHEVTATVESLSKQATKKHPHTPKPPAPDTKPLSWDDLLAYVRTEHVALYSVLSKCSHTLEDNELTLYTGNAFYKKKLDDARYRSALYAACVTVAGYEPVIHTLPTGAPMKNSQAAAIADMMGGGIEVSPDT